MIFASTGFMRVQPSDVEVELRDGLAWVGCIENLFSVHDQGTVHGRVAATNLFVRTPDGWRMCLHHGSAIASAGPSASTAPEIPS